jgi:hypothetical protein
MYQSPPGGVKVPVPNVGNVTWVSWGVTLDGGGLTGRGPVPPWNPFGVELAAGLALAASSSSVDQSLRALVLQLAAEQVQLAAGNIAHQMLGALSAQADRKPAEVKAPSSSRGPTGPDIQAALKLLAARPVWRWRTTDGLLVDRSSRSWCLDYGPATVGTRLPVDALRVDVSSWSTKGGLGM